MQWASPTSSGVQQQTQQQQYQQHNTINQQQQQQHQQQQQQHYHSPSPAPSSVSGGNIQQHSSSTHTTKTTTSSSQHNTAHQDQQFGNQSSGANNQQQLANSQSFDLQNNQELQQWMGQLSSPLIHQHQDIANEDGKCMRLRFDVSQYSADEVSVKTVDGKLRVHAKHEEKSETKSAYREFNKEFSLPIGTNPEAIKSTLSRDGILTVEVPLPGQPGQLAYGGQQPALSNY